MVSIERDKIKDLVMLLFHKRYFYTVISDFRFVIS